MAAPNVRHGFATDHPSADPNTPGTASYIGQSPADGSETQWDPASVGTPPSGAQPVDSDLTAIAGLATTAFGRSLLTLADAAAGRTAFGFATAPLPRIAAGVPTGAPTFGENGIAIDTTAVTGGVYGWSGTAWVKGASI